MTSTQSRKRKTKYPFTLRSLDITNILSKYGFDMLNQSDETSVGVTKLDDLIIKKDPEYFFLDETRNIKKCSVAMKDLLLGTAPPNINCFWCRNSFDTTPLGCPIEYVPSKVIKKYFSEITKDYYTIKENIDRNSIEKFKEMVNNNDKNTRITVVENDYYLTDGVFCSFNCCLSWIRDNSTNPMYSTSANLLHQIYYETFDQMTKIQIAPHWRLLKEYGGKMTIEEFRKSYNNTIYKESNTIKSLIKTKPIGTVFEEYIKI